MVVERGSRNVRIDQVDEDENWGFQVSVVTPIGCDETGFGGHRSVEKSIFGFRARKQTQR